MKAFKITLIAFITFFLMTYVYNYFDDYKELYRIKGVKAELFKVSGKTGDCFLLEKIVSPKVKDTLILGVKFNIEYYSKEINYKHFLMDYPDPLGAYGHEDIIKNIKIKNSSNHDLKGVIDNASNYSLFKINDREHIEGNSKFKHCYKAITPQSINHLISEYNETYDYDVYNLKNYFFFNLNNSKIETLNLSDLKIEIITQ